MTLTREGARCTHINVTRQSAPAVAFLQSELSPQPPDMSSLSDSEKEQLQAVANRRRNADKSDATCGGPAKRAALSAARERTIGRGARIKNGATGGSGGVKGWQERWPAMLVR